MKSQELKVSSGLPRFRERWLLSVWLLSLGNSTKHELLIHWLPPSTTPFWQHFLCVFVFYFSLPQARDGQVLAAYHFAMHGCFHLSIQVRDFSRDHWCIHIWGTKLLPPSLCLHEVMIHSFKGRVNEDALTMARLCTSRIYSILFLPAILVTLAGKQRSWEPFLHFLDLWRAVVAIVGAWSIRTCTMAA